MAKRKIPVDMKAMKAIAGRIQSLRKQRGLTQAALAAAIEIEPASMSRLETAKRPVSGPLLHTIAGHLGVSVSELLGERPEASDADEAQLLNAWRTLKPRVRAATLVLVRELAGQRSKG